MNAIKDICCRSFPSERGTEVGLRVNSGLGTSERGIGGTFELH